RKNPSGFLSKSQKQEAKETVSQKIEADMKSGKFRRSKIIPLLWDLANQTVYCSAAGANFEKLAEIFERSFKCELQPLSAGSLGQRVLVDAGQRGEYEDVKPARFAHGPE